MNKKKEIDKLARLTILNNFISSKLKEQKNLVKSFVTSEDKVLKGMEHKINVINREYKRFDSEAFRTDQPEVYNSYKTKVVQSMELKPIVDDFSSPSFYFRIINRTNKMKNFRIKVIANSTIIYLSS